MIKKVKETRKDKIVSKRKALTESGKGKALIWTRVSSEDQYRNNNSLDTQLEACRRYCAVNNKEVKHEFGGTFESAKVAGEGFLQMVGAALNDYEVDTIVVYDYDRFSRNLEEGLAYKGQLNRNGITIVAVNQPVDKNNLLAKHMEAILLIVADIDNAMRRHKCYEGMVACINRGEWYSKPPLGYDGKKVDKKHQITVNDKGRILKNAWLWIANEPNITQSKIVERLRARGLEITKQRLSACLRNSFYCGRLEHKYLNGGVIKGVQEPLISEALFDKVQQILDGNPNGYEQATETPRFPLKSHIFYNGHMLTGYTAKAKNIDYYKYSGKDGAVNVSAKELHAKYVELLGEFAVPPRLIPILKDVLRRKFEEKEGVQAVEVDNIQKRIATLKTQIKTVKRRFAVGDIEKDVYDSVEADLRAELVSVERELERASVSLSNLAEYIDDAIAIACNLGAYWDRRDFEVCQKIQNLVFPEGVIWDKENRCYRTQNCNQFFDLTRSISADFKAKEKDKSCDLSCLVAGGGLEPPASGL